MNDASASAQATQLRRASYGTKCTLKWMRGGKRPVLRRTDELRRREQRLWHLAYGAA